jgi:hypothetical protein
MSLPIEDEYEYRFTEYEYEFDASPVGWPIWSLPRAEVGQQKVAGFAGGSIGESREPSGEGEGRMKDEG